MNPSSLVEIFSENAKNFGAEVQTVDSLQQAFEYTVSVCAKKEACQILASGCEFPLSDPAEELCGLKSWNKLVAAPGFDSLELEKLAGECSPKGIGLVEKGLHSHLGGIDIGLTRADFAIAETGTLVVNCPGEDLRLATMISEIHIAILHIEQIYATALDVEDYLHRFFSKKPDYTAFITGPSRTADIERVLTLGVHGPLEVHVLILRY